jgi:hypothetical protein
MINYAPGSFIAEGQAENRRVVVRALLNKGIAGTELPLPETKK